MHKWLDMTPKHEKDYFIFFRWQVGRKLALIICLAVIVCCLAALLFFHAGAISEDIGGYPVFAYDSLFLKFYSGNAAIQANDGHIAYLGKVSKGRANGRGTLYDAQGRIIYKGNFASNAYQGNGTLYHSNMVRKYEGQFQDGKKQGAGILYGENGTAVFEGSFYEDEIIYEELVGRPTSEISSAYAGQQALYMEAEDSSKMYVFMEDIGAIYCAVSKEGTLEEGWAVKSIYVLESKKPFEALAKETPDEPGEGKLQYMGQTQMNLGDALAFEFVQQQKDSGEGQPEEERTGKSPLKTTGIEAEEGLQGVYEVKNYNKEEMYISVYEKEGFQYTFFNLDEESSGDTCLFYSMELL
ncbi:MORN repeat-containing protein [Luxibacter massiliensis]|uniref:hypothetical protein n=1 Tax=Luxibacter massiliensis TaxID=2219695 RepID=UPI000F06F690|nr:hypothetical protein [Luxibacter massiliensis]